MRTQLQNRRSAPAEGEWRHNGGSIGSWMNVLRSRGYRKLSTGMLCISEKLKTLCDGNVVRIKFHSTSISIDSVSNLIVAALVETTEIKPNFRHIGIDADSTRVGVKRISKLINLEVEDTDRTPESGIAAIPIYSLLISFICLIVLLACHVGTTQKVPTLCVRRILKRKYKYG